MRCYKVAGEAGRGRHLRSTELACLSRAPRKVQARLRGSLAPLARLDGSARLRLWASMVFAAQRRPSGRLWSAKTMVSQRPHRTGVVIAKTEAKERLLSRLTTMGRCGPHARCALTLTLRGAKR